jgi:CRISPR/Cas system endoribonuclease Cas6 (RAMP superfamily)
MIERAAQVETDSASLRWCDWERYSNRQQTKMKLGGFLGATAYSGAIEEFLPLVAAGEILHVGGSTSFGLGRYEILQSK